MCIYHIYTCVCKLRQPQVFSSAMVKLDFPFILSSTPYLMFNTIILFLFLELIINLTISSRGDRGEF